MLSKPTPVRFSDDADRRLGAVAAANGMTKAELIRVSLDWFLDEVERTGSVRIQQVVRAPAQNPGHDLDDMDEDPHVRAAMDAGRKRGFNLAAQRLKAEQDAGRQDDSKHG